jgi:hypothetical protein
VHVQPPLANVKFKDGFGLLQNQWIRAFPASVAKIETLLLNSVFQAYSRSQTFSILDYGTNYCNLFNLMDGSGLILDPAYTEETDDSICTQYSTADCDIYK